jgi:hypothetical protein
VRIILEGTPQQIEWEDVKPIDLAQDSDNWRADVKAVMGTRVS